MQSYGRKFNRTILLTIDLHYRSNYRTQQQNYARYELLHGTFAEKKSFAATYFILFVHFCASVQMPAFQFPSVSIYKSSDNLLYKPIVIGISVDTRFFINLSKYMKSVQNLRRYAANHFVTLSYYIFTIYKYNLIHLRKIHSIHTCTYHHSVL